jgi:hypothetical protein
MIKLKYHKICRGGGLIVGVEEKTFPKNSGHLFKKS